MMGGHIWVESDVTQQKGSTFHFTIKCHGSDSKRPVYLQNRVDIQTAAVMDAPAEHPKHGILLVHPCQLTSEWFKQTTSHWNIHTQTVSALDEAIRLVTHSNSANLFTVIVDYRAMSTVSYVDVETDQPVDDVTAHSTGSPADPQGRSVEKVYRRYTIDADLVTQAHRLIQQCCKLNEQSLVVPRLVITGPISLQGVIRTILKAVHQSHYAFVSSPIKVATLFQTLYDAAQPSSPAVRPSLSSQASSVPGTKREVSASKKAFCSMDLVLVVEDNNVNRKIYNRMLLALGFRDNQIQTAVNGQVGLNALLRWVDRNAESSDPSTESKSDKPRTRVCLLLDSVMPVMTGPECARAIRASSQIPAELQPYIIALTANASVDDKENCLASGMDEYLTKPITLDELQQALERGAREGHHCAR